MGAAMEYMPYGVVVNQAIGIPDTWERLFAQALKLVAEIATYGRSDPFWTFGGGTVLMLRHYDALLGQLESRYQSLKKQFDAVDALNFHPTFDAACASMRAMLLTMHDAHP